MDLKRDVLILLLFSQVFYPECHLANFLNRRQDSIRELFAGHQEREFFIRNLAGGVSADQVTVFEHADTVGDLQHFIQPVTDKNDADISFFQIADNPQ